MDTKAISNAQLNVSKHYTVESINKLISRFNQCGFTSYYNTETKSIDVEPYDTNIDCHIITIKEELKDWVNDYLPVDSNTITIVRNNIDFIYNITQINTDNGIIIKVYLY